MHVDITGHQIEVTDALKSYVEEKMARIERYTDDVTTAHVILSVEKLRHIAEANVHVKGEDLHAEAEENDLYAAIDALSEKLERQARRHKEKLTDRNRSGGSIKHPSV
ncbi:MAG: ribosome-associated translation inhibitor RaiA [Gammaproteobacteria bacterium]|nr:ribosome-associated translation inhibitor RaiA [Gammaproteobacteria bacterium]